MQKFKTSICKNYQSNDCSMGDACHFAHGEEDLRKVTDVSFIYVSHCLSIFMNFTNQRRQQVLPNLITRLLCAKTSQNSEIANLGTDALFLTGSMIIMIIQIKPTCPLCILNPTTCLIILSIHHSTLRHITLNHHTEDTLKCKHTHPSIYQLGFLKMTKSGARKPTGTILRHTSTLMEDSLKRHKCLLHHSRTLNKVLKIANIND